MVVTTHQEGALTAVSGQGVGDGRRGDGLDVGRLPVVAPLLPPGPEGGHRAVPDLGPELVSTLPDGQLSPGRDGGGQGQVSLETAKIENIVRTLETLFSLAFATVFGCQPLHSLGLMYLD